MLAATVGVYDENVIAPNTVDFVAPGSNVTNTQLAADVASAFSQNRSGVIDGSVLGGQYEFGVSQSKTLSVSNTLGIGSPSGGREISGTGAFATGSPSYNSTSFSFNSITNGQPNEHVIEFGVTALSLTNRNYGNVTTTGYLASGGTVSATRPISEANGVGDTFFGFRAPANDYFSRFTIGYSGAESSPDFRLWIDDIGFVTGVVGPNTVPVAMNDSYTINEDSFLDIQTPGVLNNDTDADGNSLTAIKLTNPTNGVAVLQPNGALRYFPNFNFSGTDTFTYKVNDGSSDSNVAVVTITVNPVNDAPFVDSPTVTTDEDTPYSGLIDSIDVEGDSYSFSLASDPSHGTAIVNTDGTFTYSPSLDYFGSDSFVFRATDTRNATRLGTVTVNIVPVNDAPIARDDNYSVEESGTLTLSSLAVSRLTMASEPGDWVGQGQSYDYFAPSANFTANKNFDNGVSLAVTQSFLAHQESWNLNFAAPFDALLAPGLFTGATRFPFQSSSQPGLDVSGIGRGHNMLDGEFVVYDVGYGPNNSVTRFAGSFIQREHSNTSPAPSLTGAVRFNSSIGTGGGVTANDLDIEGDLFTTVLASGPSNGSLTLNKDGTLVYTPNTGFSGEDTFTYRANDGRSLSNLATATITVNAVGVHSVKLDLPWSGWVW